MKNKCRLIVPVLFLFSFHETISGQEQVNTDNKNAFKHYLGVGAGFTTGYGLSYRFLPKRFGIQATTAYIKDNYTENFNLGLTLLYKLIEAEKTNFFLYQGNQFNYKKHTSSYYSENPTENNFNNSIGIGIEFIILKRVSFNLMGGYAAFENFKRIGFTGETGLFFKF